MLTYIARMLFWQIVFIIFSIVLVLTLGIYTFRVYNIWLTLAFVLSSSTAFLSHIWHLAWGEDYAGSCEIIEKEKMFGWFDCFNEKDADVYNLLVNTYEVTVFVEVLFLSVIGIVGSAYVLPFEQQKQLETAHIINIVLQGALFGLVVPVPLLNYNMVQEYVPFFNVISLCISFFAFVLMVNVIFQKTTEYVVNSNSGSSFILRPFGPVSYPRKYSRVDLK